MFTNRFYAYAGPAVVQLVFKNQLNANDDEAEVCRVAMTRDDAAALAALLSKVLAQSVPLPG